MKLGRRKGQRYVMEGVISAEPILNNFPIDTARADSLLHTFHSINKTIFIPVLVIN